MVLAPDPNHEEEDPRGVGWIMNHNFQLRKSVHMHDMIPSFNMHEFNILDNGRTALVVTKDPEFRHIPFPSTNKPSSKQIRVKISNNGFQEIDILTGEVLFGWNALDHVALSETLVPLNASDINNPNQVWDFIHLNSVDKGSEGDYLISGRHTSAIYKVSRDDGSIIWQLGGFNSSFEQIGFNFSHQHDARFQYQKGPITVISYLNNAADREMQTANYSTAQFVKLNTDKMTATLLTEWDRPDHNLTRLRGNVQVLDNGNTFVGWSANSYISEFTPDGELALEAQFKSERFATYRTYKFNFTGLPLEPPTLKAFAYGTDSSSKSTSTVSYVSWNGATEVVSWNFYAKANDSSVEEFTYIGNANRTGFETIFTVDGYMGYIMAEGIDKDGKILGNSSVEETELPSNWISASSSRISDHDLDKNLFQVSVEAIKDWASGSKATEGKEIAHRIFLFLFYEKLTNFIVRIPLSIFLLFFCICTLGTIFGMVYTFRRRVPWLCGSNYQKIEGEQESEMEEGYVDLEKSESKEEDDTHRYGDYDTSDNASDAGR